MHIMLVEEHRVPTPRGISIPTELYRILGNTESGLRLRSLSSTSLLGRQRGETYLTKD